MWFRLNSTRGGCPELGICFKLDSIGGALRSSVAVLHHVQFQVKAFASSN